VDMHHSWLLFILKSGHTCFVESLFLHSPYNNLQL
jgi:hypothetical protein